MCCCRPLFEIDIARLAARTDRLLDTRLQPLPLFGTGARAVFQEHLDRVGGLPLDQPLFPDVFLTLDCYDLGDGRETSHIKGDKILPDPV